MEHCQIFSDTRYMFCDLGVVSILLRVHRDVECQPAQLPDLRPATSFLRDLSEVLFAVCHIILIYSYMGCGVEAFACSDVE